MKASSVMFNFNISNMMNRFADFFTKLAEEWIQLESDALQVTYEKLRSPENIVLSDLLVKNQRNTEIIKRNIQHLKSFYHMFIDMGLTDEQAKTIMFKFCYENNAPVERLEELIELYEEYNTLHLFSEESNNTSYPAVFKTHNKYSKDEKKTKFFMIVQSCLPDTADLFELENNLTEAADAIMEGRLKGAILTASGFAEERLETQPVKTQQMAANRLKSIAT